MPHQRGIWLAVQSEARRNARRVNTAFRDEQLARTLLRARPHRGEVGHLDAVPPAPAPTPQEEVAEADVAPNDTQDDRGNFELQPLKIRECFDRDGNPFKQIANFAVERAAMVATSCITTWTLDWHLVLLDWLMIIQDIPIMRMYLVQIERQMMLLITVQIAQSLLTTDSQTSQLHQLRALVIPLVNILRLIGGLGGQDGIKDNESSGSGGDGGDNDPPQSSNSPSTSSDTEVPGPPKDRQQDRHENRHEMKDRIYAMIRWEIGEPLHMGNVRSIKTDPPEKYTGSKSMDEFDKWLPKLLNYILLMGLAGPDCNAAQIKLLGANLAGAASQWFETIVNPMVPIGERIRNWRFDDAVWTIFKHFVCDVTINNSTCDFEDAKLMYGYTTHKPADGLEDIEAMRTEWTVMRTGIVNMPSRTLRKLVLPDLNPIEMRVAVMRLESMVRMKEVANGDLAITKSKDGIIEATEIIKILVIRFTGTENIPLIDHKCIEDIAETTHVPEARM
ncbi:hypothetical protein C8J56DRAFT_1058195 [Mycena floridula]|nr:hypothetical protein C8J56DRAFT_1058195 [Mycena floridula]